MAFIIFNEAEMHRMLRTPNGMVGEWMDQKGRTLVGLAKRQVGVDTGDLRRSITHKTTGESYGVQVLVSANDEIAMMHHNGTRAHRIEPVRQQVLRFVVRGKVVYARQVWHPGTKPNKFLTDNLPRVI